ncbi:bifunctional oligoribonuclease/PAP phosphatase NrnA [Candidatus Dojkabacteria bacterium]|nr:bifunctional oligoribonuclease/PAP phosphatase NrnA [Candidatus Dojkabacteria bacterium]
MNKTEIESLLALIKKAKNISIITHLNPDADAIGSSLALYWILKSLKKENVRLVLEDRQPFNFKFLAGLDKFEQFENISEALPDSDLIFVLDVSEIKRFTNNHLEFLPRQKVVRIDHHSSESDIEAEMEFVDEKNSSTSEIIFSIFNDAAEFDSNVAKALLLGIYDDTNSFAIEHVSKETFEIVAKLLEKGAKVMEIAEAVNTYDQSILNGVKAFVNNLKFDDKYKYSYTYISRDLYEFLGLDGAKIDIIMNLILNIMLGRQGYSWGFLIRPKNGGTTKISFRARSTGQNVRKIAEALGGGGHDQAAGLTLPTEDPYEVLAKIRNQIEKILN